MAVSEANFFQQFLGFELQTLAGLHACQGPADGAQRRTRLVLAAEDPEIKVVIEWESERTRDCNGTCGA